MISALMSVHRVSLLTVLMDIAQYQTAVNGCKKKKKKKREKKSRDNSRSSRKKTCKHNM